MALQQHCHGKLFLSYHYKEMWGVLANDPLARHPEKDPE